MQIDEIRERSEQIFGRAFREASKAMQPDNGKIDLDEVERTSNLLRCAASNLRFVIEVQIATTKLASADVEQKQIVENSKMYYELLERVYRDKLTTS